MSWFDRDWESDPKAVAMQRALTASLLGREDRDPLAWSDIRNHVSDYVGAVKGLHERIRNLETGKHFHYWKPVFVAGLQETRCIECGISIAELGAMTLKGLDPVSQGVRNPPAPSGGQANRGDVP